MSIEVVEVSKLYGTQKALNNVSFSIGKGEIVGFLGPNGAGKSTMMKAICGYINTNQGHIKVCDIDVTQQPIETKKRIGYLPESNPLYYDMYVKEYLSFVLNLQKHTFNTKNRVDELIQLVGLEVEQNKKVGSLSKGYKQRVGLAQALINDPDVLILDEPTTGLDPNQLVEIRNLIKNIGLNKTLMLSTHIMQEVEAICNRIIIINKGEIVANDTTKNLNNESKNFEVIVEFDKELSVAELKKLEFIDSVVKQNTHTFQISSSNADVRKIISEYASKKQVLILSLTLKEKSLENIFRELTS
jgi:ABC-2 type transport system ATP-binding protein